MLCRHGACSLAFYRWEYSDAKKKKMDESDSFCGGSELLVR